MTVTPVMVVTMVTMTERDVEPDYGTRVHDDGGGVDNGRGTNNDRGWLIDHGRLGVDDGRLLHDNLLDRLMHHHRLRHEDRCRLSYDDWRRLRYDNRRRGVVNRSRFVDDDRPRFQRFGDQQARAHTCHDFTRGCPSIVAGFSPRNRTSENSQCCCYY